MPPLDGFEPCASYVYAFVSLGANWLLQSTALIAVGLLAAQVLRVQGAAVQSAICRTTLAAVLACPIVSLLFGAVGVPELPLASAFSLLSQQGVRQTAREATGILPAVNQTDRQMISQVAAEVETPPTPHVVPNDPLPDVQKATSATPARPAVHWPLVPWAALAVVWCLGAGVFAIRLFRAWHAGRQLRRSALPADPQTVARCRALAARMGVRGPDVFWSALTASPALVGILRPVVVLPEEERLSADNRDILAHELAHLGRSDLVWNFWARIATAILFFQPLVWLLARRMALAAEEVCDDCVISMGFDRPAYAGRLVDVAERYQPARAFAVGMVSVHFWVSRRVVRILDASRPLSIRAERVTRILIVAATMIATALAGLFNVGGHGASAASQAEDRIDATHITEKTAGLVITRPAAGLAKSELDTITKLLEQSGGLTPASKEFGLRDFRQITVILPQDDLPSGPREVVVYQCVRPVAASDFQREDYATKERDGKNMLVGSSNGHVALQYDDRTVITAGSEQLIDIYLAGKPGSLPRWLSAKAWESFQNDHLLFAGDTVMIGRELRPAMESFPPMLRTILWSISPLWEDATGLAVGARLDDRFTAHAWATTNDAETASRVQRIGDAMKTLVQNAVRSSRASLEKRVQPDRNEACMLLDEVEHLLGGIESSVDGNDVQLQTSVAIDAARLDALAHAIITTGQTGRLERVDPSTKEGMMALVEDFFRHNFRDVTSRETVEWGDVTETKEGNFSIRYKYRRSVWYGEPKIADQIFTFDRNGKYVSIDDAEKKTPASPARIYQVGKKVSDFPDREDLTTPEAAYASIHRAYVAEGDAAWPRFCVPTLAAQIKGGIKKPLPKEAADRFLGAEIIEVHVWDEIHAVVLAREETSKPRGGYIDMRWLTRIDGRWLNEGNDAGDTIEAARKKAEQSRSW